MSTNHEQALMLRLYQGKCEQVSKARRYSLRYWVLQLEAEALLAELATAHR
jgi:hypothetical protein